MEQDIEKYAVKEMERMNIVFKDLKTVSKDKKAKEFLEFAKNYFKDGIYFHEKRQFVEAFEAFIISWAYIDIGLKLGFFDVPKETKKFFTVDH